jgi:hypothetical protein
MRLLCTTAHASCTRWYHHNCCNNAVLLLCFVLLLLLATTLLYSITVLRTTGAYTDYTAEQHEAAYS